MHSTTEVNDSYLGSGKTLWYSIRAHGRENHVREILEFFPDRRSLKEKEEEIVNEEMLSDPFCMNLVYGGGGGDFKQANKFWSIPENKARKAEEIRQQNYRLWETEKYRAQKTEEARTRLQNEEIQERARRTKFERTGSKNGWKGKSCSAEHRKAIGEANSISQRGEKNSMFGRVWIFSDTEKKSIVIDKSRLPDFISMGWMKGRKKYTGVAERSKVAASKTA